MKDLTFTAGAEASSEPTFQAMQWARHRLIRVGRACHIRLGAVYYGLGIVCGAGLGLICGLIASDGDPVEPQQQAQDGQEIGL